MLNPLKSWWNIQLLSCLRLAFVALAHDFICVDVDLSSWSGGCFLWMEEPSLSLSQPPLSLSLLCFHTVRVSLHWEKQGRKWWGKGEEGGAGAAPPPLTVHWSWNRPQDRSFNEVNVVRNVTQRYTSLNEKKRSICDNVVYILMLLIYITFWSHW